MLTPTAGERLLPAAFRSGDLMCGMTGAPAPHSRSPSDREESLMSRTHTSDATSARLGIEIRRARVDQGLTQAEVARRMGVKPPYVAALEAGKRNVTLGQLANSADALAVGLDITFPAVAAEYRQRSQEPGTTAGPRVPSPGPATSALDGREGSLLTCCRAGPRAAVAWLDCPARHPCGVLRALAWARVGHQLRSTGMVNAVDGDTLEVDLSTKSPGRRANVPEAGRKRG
jgi:transcriptional regulator with XRE-family HTH domain